MVNVWPRRHAGALTTLLDHPLWSHHLNVDDLFSQGRSNTTDKTVISLALKAEQITTSIKIRLVATYN